MPHTKPYGILPDRLRLARVGEGYLELIEPQRFVTLYRVRGGINPLVEDPAQIQSKIVAFENALRQLHFNEQIQIILKKIPANPQTYIDEFNRRSKEDAPEIFRANFNSYYTDYLKDFFHNNRLCEYEVYVLFSIDPNVKPIHEEVISGTLKVAGVFSKSAKEYGKKVNTVQQLEEIRRRGKAWCQILAVAGLNAQELNEGEIYKLLYEEINLSPFPGNVAALKKTATAAGGPDGLQSIREALSSQAMTINKNSVQVGGTFSRTLYVKLFPEFNEDPHFLSQFLHQREDYKITLFVRGLDQETAKSTIKSQLKIDVATGDDGVTRNYDSDANAVERNTILQAVARRETGLAKYSLFVTVYGKNEHQLQANYENFSSRFRSIHTYDGLYQQEDLFFSTLPLCYNEVQYRHERMNTTWAIANCWPFFYDNLTNDTGMIIGYTASMEPVRFNPWSGKAQNFNIGVFGSQGSGKSVLTQLIQNKLIPENPVIMVIDRSGTYKTTCMAASGEYIHFGLGAEKRINPFDTTDETYFKSGIVSQDQEDAVLGFISTTVLEPGETNLDGVASAIVLEAIKKAYKSKFEKVKKKITEGLATQSLAEFLDSEDLSTEEGNIFPMLRDFRAALSSISEDSKHSSEARNLSARYCEILSQFVEDGTYANLTDRPTNIKTKSNYIVFDTSLAAKREKVKALVTYIVSTYCFNRARKCQLEKKFPMICIDEFWDLVSFKAGGDFIEILNRTARHLSLSTMWATQQIADGMKSEQARVAFNGAATKIFLTLGDEDRTLLRSLFGLSPKEMGIINGLHQVRNVYSQCYLKSSAREGLVYITLDPLLRWVVSSYPEDKNRRKEYMDYYNPKETAEDCWNAIYKLADDEFQNRKPEFLRS